MSSQKESSLLFALDSLRSIERERVLQEELDRSRLAAEAERLEELEHKSAEQQRQLVALRQRLADEGHERAGLQSELRARQDEGLRLQDQLESLEIRLRTQPKVTRAFAPSFGAREFLLLASGALLATATFWFVPSPEHPSQPPAIASAALVQPGCTSDVPVPTTATASTPAPIKPHGATPAPTPAEITNKTAATTDRPHRPPRAPGHTPPTSSATQVVVDDCVGKGPLCALPE